MTALSRVAGKWHCLPFGIEGNDSELSKKKKRNALYVRAGAHNAVWAECCFDFFPQLCDILCNYLRLQTVFFFCVISCTDPLNVS